MTWGSSYRRVLEKEFKGIAPFIQEAHHFEVQVVDLELLALEPYPDDEDALTRDIIFFDEEGRVLGHAGKDSQRKKSGRLRKWWTGKEFYEVKYYLPFSETVDEALERVDPEGTRVRYILEVLGAWVTVHKVPKHTNIGDHIAALEREAAANIDTSLEKLLSR